MIYDIENVVLDMLQDQFVERKRTPVLGGVLRDERTRWGIKILLEVPRSTKKYQEVE